MSVSQLSLLMINWWMPAMILAGLDLNQRHRIPGAQTREPHFSESTGCLSATSEIYFLPGCAQVWETTQIKSCIGSSTHLYNSRRPSHSTVTASTNAFDQRPVCQGLLALNIMRYPQVKGRTRGPNQWRSIWRPFGNLEIPIVSCILTWPGWYTHKCWLQLPGYKVICPTKTVHGDWTWFEDTK